MDIITIESIAFNRIMEQLSTLAGAVERLQREMQTKEEDELWVDNYDACTFLRISQRTLQRLRSSGKITYSTIEGRQYYYQIREIKKMLQLHLIKSDEDALQDLINNTQLYAEQRKRTKPNQQRN